MTVKQAQEMLYVAPTVADLYNLMSRTGTTGPALDYVEALMSGLPVSAQLRDAARADAAGDKWLEAPGKHRGLSSKALETLRQVIETGRDVRASVAAKFEQILKGAQEMSHVPADSAQLLSRMRQVAAKMGWTKETSPALAFMELANSGGQVDESLRQTALVDAESYAEASGARLGFDPSGLQSLINFVRTYGSMTTASASSALLKVAAKFVNQLKK